MSIFLYDDDPRLKLEGLEQYSKNSGSFAVITNNLNKELAKLGLLGSEEASDWIGFASGLKWGFGFGDRKRFLINVWESNILPELLLRMRPNFEHNNYKVFGLSKQISDVWQSYGYETPIVDIGCDTEFWKPQPVKKFAKFTILSTTAANFRSGIPHLITAYKAIWASGIRDIKLVIKNTDERAYRLPNIIKDMQDVGMDVSYLCERENIEQIRELMASCHLLCYNVLGTSAGLPILEAASMELPCLVTDASPTNIYPSCGKIKCTEKSIAEYKSFLCDTWGLPYNFAGLGVDEEKAMLNWLDISDFTEKILDAYHNYDKYIEKAKECRKQVLERWTWSHSCNQLLNNLSQKV